MPEIPVLESERLRLRGWTSDDAGALRRIYGDPVTMRFIGDGSPMPPDRAWHALAFLLDHRMELDGTSVDVWVSTDPGITVG